MFFTINRSIGLEESQDMAFLADLQVAVVTFIDKITEAQLPQVVGKTAE